MERVASRLQKQGLSVWIDNEKLIAGTPIWESEIEKALKTAGAVVAIMSPAAKQSEWVRREISLAEQNQKRIFPVLADGDEDSAITIRLITKQFVDIRKNDPAALDALAVSLHTYLEGNQANLAFSGPMEKQPSGISKFIRSWLGRAFIGVFVGLVAGQIMAMVPDEYFTIDAIMIGVLVVAGGFTGLLLPPSRASLILVIFGFLVVGFIFSVIYQNEFGANYFIGVGIFGGAPLAAMLARILYWLKVIH